MSVSSCENLLVVAASDMGSLQTLRVYACQSLEAVFSFEGNQSTLVQLNFLSLQNLPKLVEIWKIPPPGNGTFQNLTTLSVWNCNNLRFLLPFHVAKMLVKIQKISIAFCEAMEGVIETDSEEVDDDDAELALFPDLKTLELEDLPMLEMFCSGSYISKWPALRKLVILNCPKLKTFYETKRKISDAKSTEILETNNLNSYAASLFHQKVKFPNLKELDISEKVEILHDGVLVLRNLTKLNICNCDNVRYLFSPSIARELLSIQYLEIKNCKLVEEIVVRDVEDDEKMDKLVLPQLEKLILWKLENLKWFFHGDVDFPSLVYFVFDECPRMEVLCCGTLCTPKIVKDLNDTIRSKYRSDLLKGNCCENGAESSTTVVEDVEFEEAGRQEGEMNE
ncbi:hypothetical protein M9H77_28694 [Catharanthus roseus]|uniref:Uncharacterized protein n=1 Tax=Catharanthus roseus TaxID=4058 RepID=A0ACC0AH25_CATRO|nr:hypothetical protein M9H77_28694 [Catharanthus roseus]